MKFSLLKFSLILSISALTFFGCDQRSDTEKAVDKIEEAGESVGDVFRTESEELQKDIEDLIDDIDDRMEGLESDLSEASDDAKSEIQEQIDNLKDQRKDLNSNLERLGQNIEDGWAEFKTNVNKTIENVRKDLNS